MFWPLLYTCQQDGGFWLHTEKASSHCKTPGRYHPPPGLHDFYDSQSKWWDCHMATSPLRAFSQLSTSWQKEDDWFVLCQGFPYPPSPLPAAECDGGRAPPLPQQSCCWRGSLGWGCQVGYTATPRPHLAPPPRVWGCRRVLFLPAAVQPSNRFTTTKPLAVVVEWNQLRSGAQ